MLAWSRKTAGLSIKDVEQAEKIPADVIAGWERASGTPSFAVLKRLAKRYKRPVMVFYLPEPPRDFSVVKDFRLLRGGASRSFSPALRYAIRFAQERQSWVSEYLKDEGLDKNALVGSLTESADIQEEAQRLRSDLAVSVADQKACTTDYDAFRLWRTRCEDAGLFTFQPSNIALEEMRGFALPDEYAPVVVMNSKDSPTARMFTLIHEVSHILLGNSAITGASDSAFSRSPRNRTERFCNQFAAEVLVPESYFLSIVPNDWKRRDDDVIRRVAATFRVSRLVIGLRLVETGLASEAYLRNKWPSLQAKPKKKSDSTGGPPQHVLALSRAGKNFAQVALSAFHNGNIHGGELASLLNMKLKHLPKLESAVYPSRVQPLLGAS